MANENAHDPFPDPVGPVVDEARREAYFDLSEACRKVAGLVAKAGTNATHGYRYVGHAQVLDHCRAALLDAGVVIGAPRRTKIEPAITAETKRGTQTILAFTLTIPVFFRGGHVEEFEILATVQPNDKAAYVASTAADRTLRLRLCGLGGGEAEDPEHDTHDKFAASGGW